MDQIAGILILGLVLLAPIGLVITDIVLFIKKKENGLFEFIAFFIAGIYILLAYELWEVPSYDVALNLYGDTSTHEPFSSEHVLTLIVMMLVGFTCYMILKFFRKALPPLAEVMLLGGVYLGSAVNVMCVVQLLCGASPQGIDRGADAFFVLPLCMVPLIFLIHVVELMTHLVKERAEKQESVHYENTAMQKVNLWFLKGANLFLAALIAAIPILVILMMILCLFGQQPDSVILAFTKTSDWILSKEVSPPPTAYDEHYLCTVSLRGHKKLVKPIRCGIRKGRKIIVNRQLCVANAFEQLLMERTPKLHRAIRTFYDTYGYPISRHINSAWSADITYLIMKPLEWIFVVVLYLFDLDPETRICKQYLPLKEAK